MSVMDQVYSEKAHKLTASRCRELAASAGTEHERTHWNNEAYRFDQLAAMDLADAQSAYRPVVAYDPDRPIVRVTGTCVSVTLPQLGTAHFNRDRLSTAYLALLERADETHGETVKALNRLMAEFGMDHTEAWRCTIAAAALIRYNIEP